MNRSGNRLNVSRLGTSSGLARIFIRAAQWCEAAAQTRLKAGKLLRSQEIKQASVGVLLRAGRGLHFLAQATAAVSAQLRGAYAISLASFSQAGADFTASVRSALMGRLSGAAQSEAVFVTALSQATQYRLEAHPMLLAQAVAVLTKYHPEFLYPVTTVETNASVVLRNCHPVLVSGNIPASAQLQVSLNKFVPLTAVLSCTPAFSVNLMEATRLKAPSERVAVLPKNHRTAVIPGVF